MSESLEGRFPSDIAWTKGLTPIPPMPARDAGA
jgi:hypothetical protein